MATKKVKSFIEKLNAHVSETHSLEWEGTLEDYIAIVAKDPSIHVNAHSRVLNMIESSGVKRDDEGEVLEYDFFTDDLFGVEESLEELMAYLRAAAAGSEVSRRILLLYGPTSSGKSQLAVLLKRGLEEYSKTDGGKAYCLSESPMFEDPLCAIPNSLRSEFDKEYGIKITGQLSPYMTLLLNEEYNGDFLKLPVKRFFFSEQSRVGIGPLSRPTRKVRTYQSLWALWT